MIPRSSISQEARVQCYRVLDDDGYSITIDYATIEKEFALKIYTDIVTLKTMDTIFYEAQRQGLYSFYVTLLNQTNMV
ncbi:hypothetical protein EJD97_011740 [Solanum chilense]|uniref:Uncharacterized protein n=1 Tax=Solanum chilense TaxID=4083 RepID=A0A6N2CLL3_SOLCI|nr:hypothetical protein EJD97_011740 [Solanum chilense]